ncbi:dTDP-4-amino-4,6-dideoxy-D-glucose acetyltransferase VioB [Escherichia ruysiae]|uniref:dTDP-4-amino-4,6-dideoxy-D-glucose acetyltransferase VioB n=1 Tax=Escherichia TaxID=561 RepID=UPI001594B1B2|nr:MULTISPECIES: dTDP-4-amino-4,6-dideoxy-D-glucose acetyltransferase VioB [Escherichia]EFC1528487.1 acyltransferase [Escherichia coli]EFC9524718.1 acyltransferase [Escherichia coli]EJV7177126.1 dTDP-4-amino-4,6-dideoxy-D-glucose acetyltransferase VioB [Escherichia coli]MBB2320980.1 dTDP-4-amino-4,6-dideoxy-D-glucose acetyltransferase VioB [Escherichia sp. 93.1518]MBY7381749.1 dTDP-4-amino-4,6-dideoxy-D-glucose acetyltransferase VioB [Escherichia ruysiae]
MPHLDEVQLKKMGFKSVGYNVRISDKASFYGCGNISIGNNVRIDDFCVLSAGEGGIDIHDYIHIAVYSSIIGRGKVTISDYANISSRVSIYSSNDDYSGNYMTNPVVPDEYTNIHSGPVFIGKHVIIGCGSIVLPNVILHEGAAIGALSIVKEDCESFTINVGIPAKPISERSKKLLELEPVFKSSIIGDNL